MEESTNSRKAILLNAKCSQKSLVNRMIKVLECPVCLEIFKCQVYMCENGHNICGMCKMNLDNKCPVCRDAQITNRNIAVENVIFEYNNFLRGPSYIAHECSNKLNSLIAQHRNCLQQMVTDHAKELANLKNELATCNQDLNQTTSQLCDEISNSSELQQIIDHLRILSESLEVKLKVETQLRTDAETKVKIVKTQLELCFEKLHITKRNNDVSSDEDI